LPTYYYDPVIHPLPSAKEAKIQDILQAQQQAQDELATDLAVLKANSLLAENDESNDLHVSDRHV